MAEPFIFFSSISIVLAGAYIFIISKYLSGWHSLPEWDSPPNFSPKTNVTVIVPARNEAENIIACLSSISKINYPKNLLEVIVVDDHSTDNTYDLINNFIKNNSVFKLISLADFTKNNSSHSFKKIAIQTAIARAKGDLIVTTDADCVVQQDWLLLLVSFYEIKQLQFIAAPVNFHKEKSVFEQFQSLDFLGMMGITGAGIRLRWMNMCNGANLGYSKKAFKTVGGFEGIDHLASGDDILLMQKIAAHFPMGVGFLKNKKATVFTAAKPTVDSFISQRIRWATKSTNYKEWKITLILSIVFFYCCSIIISFLSILLFPVKGAILFLLLFSIKSICDYLFLEKLANYFNRIDLIKNYWPSQFLHIWYIVFVGIASNFKKRYTWKGRRVK